MKVVSSQGLGVKRKGTGAGRSLAPILRKSQKTFPKILRKSPRLFLKCQENHKMVFRSMLGICRNKFRNIYLPLTTRMGGVK